MTYQQYNPSIVRQFAHNRKMLKIHEHSQTRLDQIRAEAALRNITKNHAVLAGGAMRNAILGAVLPVAMAAAESRRQRRGRP